ncbi:MAG: 30S ribosomal protein S21 [Bacteroidota bacterium]
MLIIEPRKGEKIDRMLRRFKKKCDKTKLTKEVRSRRYFTKSSELRRREVLKATHRDRYIRAHS